MGQKFGQYAKFEEEQRGWVVQFRGDSLTRTQDPGCRLSFVSQFRKYSEPSSPASCCHFESGFVPFALLSAPQQLASQPAAS